MLFAWAFSNDTMAVRAQAQGCTTIGKDLVPRRPACSADCVSRPEYRGCPFANAAAKVPARVAQQPAMKDYRDWLRRTFLKLAADTGETNSGARASAITAKRIARLTLAAAKPPARPDSASAGMTRTWPAL